MFNRQHECPGSAARQFQPSAQNEPNPQSEIASGDGRSSFTERPAAQSQLGQWPVQLMLVPTHAAYFTGADLAITADCVPFAFADFHNRFLKGRPLVVGCPKLDNAHLYLEKLAELFALQNLQGIEVIVMEVPCCSGMVQIAIEARRRAGVVTPLRVTTVGIRGELLGTKEVGI